MWANSWGRSPKMNDVSKLLRSLSTKNERPWANCSGRSPKMSEWANCSFIWANRTFANFFAKNERFAQKTDERIPSPASWVIAMLWIHAEFFIPDLDPATNFQSSGSGFFQFYLNIIGNYLNKLLKINRIEESKNYLTLSTYFKTTVLQYFQSKPKSVQNQ